MPITQRDRQILRIAGPSIVSNITVPLLGLVDVAIVGHLGDAAYIGAIAVGSMAFNLIYWIFGFLRMGTSGMTSQAFGRRDLACVMQLLVRSLTVALAVALTLIVLQWPLEWTMVRLMRPTADVEPWARTYFSICIWGAPAVLGLYGLMGWFVGMQNTRMPMFISIMQNVVNIFASLTFVYGLGMRIEGVATGTVIAQYAGFAAAIVLLLRHYGRLGRYMVWRGVLQRNELWRLWLSIYILPLPGHVRAPLFLLSTQCSCSSSCSSPISWTVLPMPVRRLADDTTGRAMVMLSVTLCGAFSYGDCLWPQLSL